MRSLALAALTILATLAYLGLAVLGWGGFAAFFSHPPLIAVAVILVALAAIALFSAGNLSRGEREDRANRWVLIAFSFVGLGIAFLPALTDRLDLWTLDGDQVRWLGDVLFAVGNVLRLWPVFVLGHRFSGLVAIQQNHQLVTSGVYSRIRHPSYLGLIISTAGWALAFRSVVGLLLTAALVPILVVRMNAEEALLTTHFGAEYESYKRRTRRFVPGVY